MIYWFLKIFIAPIMWLILRPMVLGQENLNIKGKAIFAINHIAAFDPLLIAIISPRIVHFMAKKELFEKKLPALLMRAVLAFPVSRETADRQSLKKAMAVLEKGKVFGIFPEGKRSVTYELDKLNKGASFLAIRTGAPIVPIYIHSSSYDGLRPKVAVGKPINVSELVADSKKSALVDVVTDEISDAISALRIELEEKIEGNKRR